MFYTATYGSEEIMMPKEHGLQHKIKVLVSKDFGREQFVVGREYLNDIGILSEKPPDSQGNESVLAVASGAQPVHCVKNHCKNGV